MQGGKFETEPRHTASLSETFLCEICLVYNLADVGVGVGNDLLQLWDIFDAWWSDY